MPAGQQLKSLRNRRNITVRDVEQASRRIADVKGDKRFCISNGWLAQLENGASEPSICKLFSLSVIYQANLLDLLRLYNVDVDDRKKYGPVADPYLTQLISDNDDAKVFYASDRGLDTTLLAPESVNGGESGCILCYSIQQITQLRNRKQLQAIRDRFFQFFADDKSREPVQTELILKIT